MPWIELHSNLREHPKTASLVEAMGFVDSDHAVGKLSRLWLWALEYAPDGQLHQFTESQLARAAGVDPGKGTQWVGSLVAARWLDTEPKLRIHDWWTYVGYFLKKKWDKQPDRWKRVELEYTGASPPGEIADPQRIRSGDSASPPTITRTMVKKESAGAGSVPSEAEVLAECQMRGFPEAEGRNFWDYYESRGWVDGGNVPIRKWRPRLRVWMTKVRKTVEKSNSPALLVSELRKRITELDGQLEYEHERLENPELVQEREQLRKRLTEALKDLRK